MLASRIDRAIDRLRDEQMRHVHAQEVLRRVDLESRPQGDYVGLPEADRINLRKLRMRQIALESQVRVLYPPARGESQKALDDVDAQIKAIEARAPSQPQAVQAKIDQEIAEYRAGLVAAVEKVLKTRRSSLEQDAQSTLKAHASGIPTEIPAPGPVGSGLALPAGPIPNPPIPSARIAAASLAATPGTAIDTRLSQTAMRDERARLIAVIKADIERRVAQLAVERNWSVAFVPAPGAADVTSQAADRLRLEYLEYKAPAGNRGLKSSPGM